MRFCVSLAFLLVCPSSAVGTNFISGVGNYFFPSWKSKSDESVRASLAELGVGDRAYDASKIVNVTDLNWQEFWGPHNTGEWLVEFTAHPDHCASCELVDFAFNVLIPPFLPCLITGCFAQTGGGPARSENRKSGLFGRDNTLNAFPYCQTSDLVSYFSFHSVSAEASSGNCKACGPDSLLQRRTMEIGERMDGPFESA